MELYATQLVWFSTLTDKNECSKDLFVHYYLIKSVTLAGGYIKVQWRSNNEYIDPNEKML